MEYNKKIQQYIKGKKREGKKRRTKSWKGKRKKRTGELKKMRGTEQTFLTAAPMSQLEGYLSNHLANIDWAST